MKPAVCRVLVVDDCEYIRACLRRLLQGAPGLEFVGEASSVWEGVSMFDATRPDLLILDLQMPGGSGMDVLRYVRGLGSRCVVVMLSSADPDLHRERCLGAGADHYFDKMTELQRSTETVAAIAAGWQRTEAPGLASASAARTEPST